jgi:hypothetical protein
MPANASPVNQLETRKELLIAESELNRVGLTGDIAAMVTGLSALTERAKTYGSIASVATAVVAGVSAFRRAKPSGSSLVETIVKGAGLVSTLWLAFRARKE